MRYRKEKRYGGDNQNVDKNACFAEVKEILGQARDEGVRAGRMNTSARRMCWSAGILGIIGRENGSGVSWVERLVLSGGKRKDFVRHARVFPIDSVRFFCTILGTGLGWRWGRRDYRPKDPGPSPG